MNWRIILPVVILIFAVFAGGIILKQSKEITVQTKSGNMKLTSSTFAHNQSIPSQYTCDGANTNPPLTIFDVPTNAKSLVLIMDDPDAPAGTWVHWTIWNIDPNTKEIAENNVPQGAIQGKTSFGKPGYGGPCPPSGTHRYFFKLYALDTDLSLSPQSSVTDLEKEMSGHILDKTDLIGLYSRQ